MLLAISTVSCVKTMQLQEWLTGYGSEALIDELTQGMEIVIKHPEGKVHLNELYDFIIQIDNQGKYEPHLNTVAIELFNDQKGMICTMLEPTPEEVNIVVNNILFLLPHTKIKRNHVTTIRIQCVFSQPGVYELYIGADFQESYEPFIGAVFDLVAR